MTPIIKGTTVSTLDKVIVEGNLEKETKIITDHQDLHTTLIERNKKHFNQASKTPFAKPPLSELLPPHHSNPKIANELFKGDTSSFENHNPIIQELLSQLQLLPDLTTILHKLSAEEFIQGMKNIGEGKSSSMLERHYSIYKALLHFPFTINIIVSLINDAVNNNYLLTRWRKVIQIMLCKIPGNYNINKLRVIQLLEADLNMYLHLIWGKKLVQNALKHSLFRK